MHKFIHPHWESYIEQLKNINLDNFLKNEIIKKRCILCMLNGQKTDLIILKGM